MSLKTSVAKKDIKILLLEGVDPIAKQAFINAGYSEVELLKHAMNNEALIAKLQSIKMVGVRSRTQLTDDVIKACPHLIAIGCFCIGTNQIDLDCAKMLGLPVFNAPFSNTRSVAGLVIGQMILLYRNVIARNHEMHRNKWHKSAVDAHEVRGKNLGIIGYGHIGSQVSIIAESLGLNIIFYDIETKLPLGNAQPVDSLEALLQQSDIVSLHVPQMTATKNLIGEHQIQLMKAKTVLINASHGSVVDIPALAAALRAGKLKGAGIDVSPKEPTANGELFYSPLSECDNVFLTPHIGGSTVEAQKNIALEIAGKLIKYSDNGSTLSAVNFPELLLPRQDNAHRILHIHRNKPGAMRAINRIFSDYNVNITEQFLRTSGEIGYVVMDIASDCQESMALVKAIKTIDGTIRAKVLF